MEEREIMEVDESTGAFRTWKYSCYFQFVAVSSRYALVTPKGEINKLMGAYVVKDMLPFSTDESPHSSLN